MVQAVPTLLTIGYEKLRQDELIAELQAAGVERLIDVRYRPQSRRPGLSKTRLAQALADSGIAYEHRRELGTPADLRHLYKTNEVAEGERGFRAHIREHGAEALDDLAHELRDGPRTALMCLEADPDVCHRSVLVDELRVRLPGLEIEHL